jgi:hypothetical protein
MRMTPRQKKNKISVLIYSLGWLSSTSRSAFRTLDAKVQIFLLVCLLLGLNESSPGRAVHCREVQ